jgi:cell filamentation protein
MILENKLNITNQVELVKAEEKISKKKARELYDSGKNEQPRSKLRGIEHQAAFVW